MSYKTRLRHKGGKKRGGNPYLNSKTCAELITHVTISPTRSQEPLLDRAKGCVKLCSVVYMSA